MRKSLQVKVGSLCLGGGAPVSVQSMTNTPTSDVAATAAQVLELAQAGSELVRFTVKDSDDALAVPHIVERVRQAGVTVPLVGDFHYNGHTLLTKFPACAQALDKYRINPGNVGVGEHHDQNFRTMVEAAVEHGKAVRIGVNAGSLDQALLARLIDEDSKSEAPRGAHLVTLDAMVASALSSAQLAQSYGLEANRIVLSAKISSVPEVIEVYRKLAKAGNYALHVGLTEAGMGMKGIVASSIALGSLLQEGIGDTIRVSLTPRPGESRAQEVYVAQEVLQSLNMRAFAPQVTSCPGCGRTSSTRFQSLALQVQQYLREVAPQWRQEGYVGFESLKVAVMGCIVNGPGEAKDANIGISLPGNGERVMAPVFIEGSQAALLQGDNLAEQFIDIVKDYAAKRFGPVPGLGSK